MLPEVEDYSIDPEPFSIQTVDSTKRRFGVYDLTKCGYLVDWFLYYNAMNINLIILPAKTNFKLMMKWKEAFFEYGKFETVSCNIDIDID